MLDKILDFVVVALPLAMGIMGTFVGIKLAKDPRDTTHKPWWWAIIVAGVVCGLLIYWQQERGRFAHSKEIVQLNTSINDVKSQLQKSELDRVFDTRYLQGKLDVFAQFAPAIMKLAQATEENTRRQYEAKTASDKDLYEFTMEVVTKLREFSHKYTTLDDQVMAEMQASWRSNLTDDEKRQIWSKQTQKSAKLTLDKNSEFRQFILPDALYARQELLRRKLVEPELSDMQKAILRGVLSNGMLAGVYPELLLADYLELLAKPLKPHPESSR